MLTFIVVLAVFIAAHVLGVVGALRLVRFAADRPLPAPARIPQEFVTGEWHHAPDDKEAA